MIELFAILADGTEGANYTAIVTSVANIGFSGIVAWYLLTRALPAVIAEMRVTLKEQREDFKLVLQNEKENAKATLEIVAENIAAGVARRDEKLERMANQVEQLLALVKDKH